MAQSGHEPRKVKTIGNQDFRGSDRRHWAWIFAGANIREYRFLEKEPEEMP